MTRRITQLGSVSLAVGALVAGALAAPAAAAARPAAAAARPSAVAADTFSYAVGSMSWTLRGKVSGLPGNAHSGGLTFDTSEPEIGGSALDWRCPSGVTPPVDYAIGGTNSTSCTIVRYRVFYPTDSNYVPTFSGPLHATVDSTFDFSTLDPTTGSDVDDTALPITLVFNRVGPIHSTRQTMISDGVRTVSVTQTAPMRASGHAAGLSFSDSRLHQAYSVYERHTDTSTPVG